MRRVRPLLVACLAAPLVACSSPPSESARAPHATTDGDAAAPPQPEPVAAETGLELVEVEAGRQTNGISPVLGGRCVLVQTAGGHGGVLTAPRLLSWDATLRPTARILPNVAEVGPSADGTRALRTDVFGLSTHVLPGLATDAKLAWPEDFHGGYDIWGVPAREGGAGWAVVAASGEILRIDTGPLRVGARGRSFKPNPSAMDVDDATGLLAMTHAENRFGAFDLGTMTVAFLTDLPCEKLSYDVAAGAGVAWISTDDGTGRFLEFDLRTRGMRRAYETGLEGCVSLARSADRTHLATLTIAWDRRTEEGAPARLRVFRLAAEGPVEVASLRTALRGVANDVAIVPEWGTVLVAGTRTLAWRYAAPASGGR